MNVKTSLDKNTLTVSFSEIKEADKSREANIAMELLKKLGSYDSSPHIDAGTKWTVTRERSGSQHLYLAQQVLRSFCIDV
jgi:hypothetical protein